MLPEGCYAIQNDSLYLGGVLFAGSRGWQIPGEPEGDSERTGCAENCDKLFLSEPCSKFYGKRHEQNKRNVSGKGSDCCFFCIVKIILKNKIVDRN